MSFQLIEIERSVTPFAQTGDNVETKVPQTEPEVTTDSSPEEPTRGKASPDSSPVSEASDVTKRSEDSPREEPESGDKTVTPEEPIQTSPKLDEPVEQKEEVAEKEELAPTPEPEVDEAEDVSNDSYLVRSPAEPPEYTDTETTQSSDQ